jgi:hypothetical protein
MKLFPFLTGCTLSVSDLVSTVAFSFTPPPLVPSRTVLKQIYNRPQLSKGLGASSTDTEKAFSAFAESLDEDEILSDDQNSDYSAMGSRGIGNVPWQESLELLLDPATPAARRQILLSDLLNANADIRKDVMDAIQEKKVRQDMIKCFKASYFHAMLAYG